MKLTESSCIRGIKKFHAKIVADKIIQDLKKLKDIMLSGEDSGLNNCWEEYVVQIQGEDSIYFEAYSDIVRNFIELEISKQPLEIQKILDFFENENYDEEHEEQDDQFYYMRDLAVDEIIEYVQAAAANFENKRTEKYLGRY